MAISNGYCTLQDVKSRLDIKDSDNNSELESVITAVSRWIDRNRNRRIYAATETRYYTPEFHDYLIIDDLLSVTTLKTDDNADDTHETTWTTSDYNLWPANASAKNRPYDQIIITNSGDYSFPVGIINGVEIAGSFGYASTTPPAITEACILATMRVWKRRDALFGIIGSAEMGTIQAAMKMVNDSELMSLLETVPIRLV